MERSYNDLYLNCATYLGCSRKEAKTRLLEAVYTDNGTDILDMVTPDMRADMLNRCGIVVGEN